MSCRVPEEGPAEVVELMQACMHEEPEARPTAKEVINRLQAAMADHPSPH